MKNEGGREAGKCSKIVPDRGLMSVYFFMKPVVFSSTYLFVKLN
jgi:hypothetical protein